MKIKTFILLAILGSFLSCTNDQANVVEKEEHAHEHGEEGLVTLNEKQQKALDLKLGTFQMRNLTTVIKSNGQLEVPPKNRAGITAIIGGNVKAIEVFLGDKVKKGQILAVLEHPDYISLQEDFAVIASNLGYLKQEYERQEELYNNKVGAGKDYQKAKTEYNTAKVKYEGLKARLQLINLSPEKVKKGNISNTIDIISPIAGYVNQVNIKVGIYVDAQRELFEIVDNSAIHADFLVYEKDVHLLSEGQKIHFTVSNRSDHEFTAQIFAIGKEFDQNTRAVHIHANINGDIEGLIPGMYITGHLHTDGNYTKTLPNDAIVTEGVKSYIFIVKNDDHEGHNHDGETHEHEGEENNHDGHNHREEDHNQEKHSGSMSFKMTEVIIGKSDEGYTEVRLLENLPNDTKVVMNAAYYLLSDLKKEETEHEH